MEGLSGENVLKQCCCFKGNLMLKVAVYIGNSYNKADATSRYIIEVINVFYYLSGHPSYLATP